MNKQELISNIAKKSGLSKKSSEEALNAFIETVEETLVQGEKIQLIGFGTFDVKERAERTGKNPQTKEEIIIPAKKVPAFKFSSNIKDTLKNNL